MNGDPVEDPEFDPSDADHDAQYYYTIHNTNYNVQLLLDDTGIIKERNELTPYGERTTFISPGSNDPDCYAPTHLPTRVTLASGPAPYGINDVGFQGRPHDDVTGNIDHRNRVWHVRFGQWMQNDLLDYIDGMNRRAGYHAMWGGLDPWGLDSNKSPNQKPLFKHQALGPGNGVFFGTAEDDSCFVAVAIYKASVIAIPRDQGSPSGAPLPTAGTLYQFHGYWTYNFGCPCDKVGDEDKKTPEHWIQLAESSMNPIPQTGAAGELIGELAADVAGVFDPTPTTDLAHASYLASKGEYFDATLTAGGTIPVVGDLVGKGLKWVAKPFRWAYKKLKVAPKGVVDANKLNHIFGDAGHGLDGVVKQLGSQEAAYQAMQQATEAAVKSQGLTGLFRTTIQVGGETITVKGNVVNGAVKIGTAFK